MYVGQHIFFGVSRDGLQEFQMFPRGEEGFVFGVLMGG